MGSVNKVILVGNLGRDAELRYTPGGAAVLNFSMATTETWKDKATSEKKEQTEWHKVVRWGRTAETLNEYLVKGKQVYIEGRLQTRQWEDKEGQKRSTTEVRGDRVVLLGSGGGRGASGGRSESSGESGGGRDASGGRGESSGESGGGGESPVLTDDDIPF